MAVLLACGAGPASAADMGAERDAGVVQADLIDYEFSQSRGLFAWNDCCGTLWLGRVDRATGRFIPADGKGVLVDPDTMTFQDAQKTKNGPEWVSMLGGDVIVYTKYSGRHTDGNSRIGLAYPMTPSSSCAYISSDGYWCAGDLGPEDVRKAPYGSKVDNDPAPRISYVDNRENHYWRELLNPGTEQPIPDFPASNYPIRLTACADPTVPGVRSAVYPVTIDGVQQAVWRDFDSGVVTQLTFDPGTKYEVWMWCAPEYGNELVFFTLVDQVELRVYRNLPVGPGGAPVDAGLQPVRAARQRDLLARAVRLRRKVVHLHVADGRAEPLPLADLDRQHRRLGAAVQAHHAARSAGDAHRSGGLHHRQRPLHLLQRPRAGDPAERIAQAVPQSELLARRLVRRSRAEADDALSARCIAAAATGRGHGGRGA